MGEVKKMQNGDMISVEIDTYLDMLVLKKNKILHKFKENRRSICSKSLCLNLKFAIHFQRDKKKRVIVSQ